MRLRQAPSKEIPVVEVRTEGLVHYFLDALKVLLVVTNDQI
jgi:hypothetical protein